MAIAPASRPLPIPVISECADEVQIAELDAVEHRRRAYVGEDHAVTLFVDECEARPRLVSVRPGEPGGEPALAAPTEPSVDGGVQDRSRSGIG